MLKKIGGQTVCIVVDLKIENKWLCSFHLFTMHVVQWVAPDSLKVIKVWYLQTDCLWQWASDSVIKVKLSIITRSSPLFRNPPICQLRWKSGKRTMKIFPLKNVLQLREIQPSVFRQVQAIHMIASTLLTEPVGSVLVNALFLLRGVSNCWTMNEKRLSGLGMLLIHRGTNYRPEAEVIYKIYQDWGKWQSQASF